MEPSAYVLAAEIEEKHWWFRGRRAILAATLRHFLASGEDRKILEVGCGNGGNLRMLSGFGRLSACEHDAQARARAQARGLGMVEAGSLPDSLPFSAERFDLIAVLDVLEHVERDAESLLVLKERLLHGGLLLLTVPAHQWLWTKHDEFSGHCRRYTRPQVSRLLTGAGFRVIHLTYFNSILFPLAVAYLLANRLGQGRGPGATRVPNPLLNRLLEACFRGEAGLVPYVRLPLGLSLLAVAERE